MTDVGRIAVVMCGVYSQCVSGMQCVLCAITLHASFCYRSGYNDSNKIIQYGNMGRQQITSVPPHTNTNTHNEHSPSIRSGATAAPRHLTYLIGPVWWWWWCFARTLQLLSSINYAHYAACCVFRETHRNRNLRTRAPSFHSYD